MLICLIVVGLFVIGGFIWDFTRKNNWERKGVQYLALILWVFVLVIWVGGYSLNEREHVQFVAAKESIIYARQEASLAERAALTLQIIELNRDLADIKYWNETIWWHDLIPDEYAAEEFIK